MQEVYFESHEGAIYLIVFGSTSHSLFHSEAMMLKFIYTFVIAGSCLNKLTQATGVSIQYPVNDSISLGLKSKEVANVWLPRRYDVAIQNVKFHTKRLVDKRNIGPLSA